MSREEALAALAAAGIPADQLDRHVHDAWDKNNTERMRLLIRAGAPLNFFVDGLPPLLSSAAKGNVEIVSELLDAGAAVDGGDHRGMTALMIAALYGHPNVIDTLLQRGAVVNQADQWGWTAVMHAAGEGECECVRRLIAAHADVNHRAAAGWTALDAARVRKHSDCARLLTAATSGATSPPPANIPARAPSPVVIDPPQIDLGLVARGQTREVSFTVTQPQAGQAPLDVRIGSGVLKCDPVEATLLPQTPLKVRARYTADGYHDGPFTAQIGITGPMSEWSAFLPVSGEAVSAPEWKTEETIDFGSVPAGYLTARLLWVEMPYQEQSTGGGRDPWRYVLRFDAKPEGDVQIEPATFQAISGFGGETTVYFRPSRPGPIRGAVSVTDTTSGRTVRVAVTGGVVPPARDLPSSWKNWDAEQRIKTAINEARPDFLDVLLRLGTDPLTPIQGQYMPIRYTTDCMGCLELLIRSGAAAKTQEATDEALVSAARAGRLVSAKMLVEAGARVNPSGKEDETPLLEAASFCRVQVVQWLLDHSADAQARSSRKETPLLHATRAACRPVVEMLLERGADPNVTDGKMTPLMFSARSNDRGSARALIDAGADVNPRIDGQMKSILSAFGRNMDERTATTFLNAGAR